MLKNILKLNGAQELSKNDQNTINGGHYYGGRCYTDRDCFEQSGDITDRCLNGRCFIF